jgi:6-pyruvoyl-tetrahydropterin synthase
MEKKEKPRYKYSFEHTIKRLHSNQPYSERQSVPAHEHNFRIKIKVKAKEIKDFGDNNYEVDVIIVERLFREFLDRLSFNLNTDITLGQTSCSIEDILDYVSIYFPMFLRKNNFENIKILKVSVWESDTRGVSAKLKNFRRGLKLTSKPIFS